MFKPSNLIQQMMVEIKSRQYIVLIGQLHLHLPTKTDLDTSFHGNWLSFLACSNSFSTRSLRKHLFTCLRHHLSGRCLKIHNLVRKFSLSLSLIAGMQSEKQPGPRNTFRKELRSHEDLKELWWKEPRWNLERSPWSDLVNGRSSDIYVSVTSWMLDIFKSQRITLIW